MSQKVRGQTTVERAANTHTSTGYASSTVGMAATFGSIIVLVLISAVLFRGIDGDATGHVDVHVHVASNTTINVTCVANSTRLPSWYVGGELAPAYRYYSDRDPNTGSPIAILITNGSKISGLFDVHCRVPPGQVLLNGSVTVGGRLPPPENMLINESNSAIFIEWNPPYSANNTNSSVIHVDPHITQYTVYIIDNYTGNYMDKVNVTETYLRRSIADDHSCPMYGVTAWNSGGEGDMSVPQPGYLPRIPCSIAAEYVEVRTASGTLDVRLRVTDSCAVRIPNSFLVTVMIADEDNIRTEIITVGVTTIPVSLPPYMDECNLTVRISARNSAGISPPTNISVGCQSIDYSADSTATTTTPSSGNNTNSTDQDQQEYSVITAIAVGVVVVVIMVVVVVVIMVVVVVVIIVVVVVVSRRCKTTTHRRQVDKPPAGSASDSTEVVQEATTGRQVDKPPTGSASESTEVVQQATTGTMTSTDEFALHQRNPLPPRMQPQHDLKRTDKSEDIVDDEDKKSMLPGIQKSFNMDVPQPTKSPITLEENF